MQEIDGKYFYVDDPKHGEIFGMIEPLKGQITIRLTKYGNDIIKTITGSNDIKGDMKFLEDQLSVQLSYTNDETEFFNVCDSKVALEMDDIQEASMSSFRLFVGSTLKDEGEYKMKVYLAGDIMSHGSQMEMKRIEEICEKYGHDFYSARLNMEINDKSNQTRESNDKLAEKIVKTDTSHIHSSDIFVINYKPYAIGTIVEIGQIYELWLRDQSIRVFPIYDDIRRMDIEECGDRRSVGMNQYAYGCILDMTYGHGFMTLEDLDKELGPVLGLKPVK